MKVRYEGTNSPFFVVGVRGIWAKGTIRKVTEKEWEKLKNIKGMKKVNEYKKEDK